jgi:hypothetical protein
VYQALHVLLDARRRARSFVSSRRSQDGLIAIQFELTANTPELIAAAAEQPDLTRQPR